MRERDTDNPSFFSYERPMLIPLVGNRVLEGLACSFGTAGVGASCVSGAAATSNCGCGNAL